jgi:hypothetical protein
MNYAKTRNPDFSPHLVTAFDFHSPRKHVLKRRALDWRKNARFETSRVAPPVAGSRVVADRAYRYA